jgi:hypothetical protein
MGDEAELAGYSFAVGESISRISSAQPAPVASQVRHPFAAPMKNEHLGDSFSGGEGD